MMEQNEKKVILFIVEGPSDESALGTAMRECFMDREVRFFVVHGDIMTSNGVATDTILKRINACIREIMQKYKYNINDFEKIVQITDMDGVFIPPYKVIQKKNEKLTYYIDHIETSYKRKIIERNKQKSSILCKLTKTDRIHNIPYEIYFMSRNLEHVLYGQQKDITNISKQERSDAFAEKYEGKPEDFKEYFFSDPVKVKGSYEETWNFIEESIHSLQRSSNFSVLFSK